MPYTINESIVEDAVLTWFGAFGYSIGHGPHLTPEELGSGCDSYALDDISGPPPRISVPSSPNLAASSLNLAGVWVNKLLLLITHKEVCP